MTNKDLLKLADFILSKSHPRMWALGVLAARDGLDNPPWVSDNDAGIGMREAIKEGFEAFKEGK